MNYETAKAKCRNPQAIRAGEAYVIINSQTGEPIQTSFDETAAVRDARWLNEHEDYCGRPMVYAYIPLER